MRERDEIEEKIAEKMNEIDEGGDYRALQTTIDALNWVLEEEEEL